MHAIRYIPMLLALVLPGCSGLGRTPAELPEAQKPPRNVLLALNGAAKLNTTAQGQALALVTRIYKLRQRAAFDQASFDTFLDAQREHEVFGADLIEVKELTLIPGQQLRLQEKLGREAGFIGVVGLFHHPGVQGWRLSLPAADAEKNGVQIAAHACALSLAGAPAPRCP